MRAAAVENPSAPEDVIVAAMWDEDWRVRATAIGNLSALEDAIRAAAQDAARLVPEPAGAVEIDEGPALEIEMERT